MEVSTPGRICLFGEHQDYLGLPVIAMGISLRANLKGEKRSDQKVVIHKLDLKQSETFFLDDLSYQKPRDYFKSGIKVCQNAGLTFPMDLSAMSPAKFPFALGPAVRPPYP